MSTERILAALEATGLTSKYEDRFAGAKVNDFTATMCIKTPAFKVLYNVFDSPEDYDRFVDAFSHPEKYENNQNDSHSKQQLEQSSDESDDGNLELSEKESTEVTGPDEAEVTEPESSVLRTSKSDLQSSRNDLRVETMLISGEESTETIQAEKTPNAELTETHTKRHRPLLQSAFLTSSSIKAFKTGKQNVKSFTSNVFSSIKRSSTFNRADSSPIKIDGTIRSHPFQESQSKNKAHSPTSNQKENSNLFDTKVSTEVRPVQIIDIPFKSADKQTKDETPPLLFHREHLKGILSKVGKRPVALLSIAGPSRQGKSFILGYMLRYLQSVRDHKFSDSSFDWMGKSEPKRTEPLTGGFAWRSGVERETTGIWMWPEPFTLKSPDGSEFDVLLMDTQGVFDDYTDKKDWATIVGLSLLTSSCLIFNIMNNLQEDSLITLKDFMDFGLMAVQPGDPGDLSTVPPNTDKPFQKLVFLIRDWNNPDEYMYGAEGGATYLQMNLARKNTLGGEQIRSQIKQCFQQLDCYLLPEPGKHVKRQAYDGSVAQMDSEFAEHVEKFIEHLFNPRKFPSKLISGNLATGDDLLFLFEQYVRIFNSDEMPSPQDMNQASAFICNQTILNKCLTHYEETMEKAREQTEMEVTFMLDQDLQKLNESSKLQALALFQSSRKMGSVEEVNEFKAKLVQRICDAFKLISAENSKNQNDAIEKASSKLGNYFNGLMDKRILQNCTGPDDFVLDEKFESISKECELESMDFFKGELKIALETCLEDVLPKAHQCFQNVITSLKENLQWQNKSRKSEMEKKVTEEATRLSRKYKDSIGDALSRFKYWTQAHLQNIEIPSREKVFNDFNARYRDSTLSPHGRKHLTESIQRELEDLQKLVELQNQNFLISITHLVSELANLYTQKMESSAKENYEIGSTHNNEKNYCLSTLQNTDNFDRLLPEEADKFIEDLSTRINITCEQLIDKWFPRIRQRLIKDYKTKINDFYGTGDKIFVQEELEEEHDMLKSEALKEFQNFVSQIPQPIITGSPNTTTKVSLLSTSKLVEDFETEINNHVETIYEKNTLRSEAVSQTVSGFLSKAKGRYLEIIKEINEACHPSSKFTQLSEGAKEHTLQYFQDECEENLKEKLPLEPSLVKLEEYMINVPEFKRVDPTTLEISGPSLRFSRELSTLDSILNQSVQPSSIKEVRWNAANELYMDENLCSEFWSGKNVSIYTKALHIVGNERLLVVSGENGKNASALQPPTPEKTGLNGLDGSDGLPGESGGNILILATEIQNPASLRIASNGGNGGNGQPGGNGSYGLDGVGGAERFKMSMEELEEKIPSPAKFLELHVRENRRKAKKYLLDLAKENATQITQLPCLNSASKCYTLETKEGAKFRYGFYQGGAKGLISGRSYYILFQGAPGTLGQHGGYGGLGGRGGNPGNPGKINVPLKYEDNINISRTVGSPGVSGRMGISGKNGSHGLQGEDYAVVDPYAGLYVPSNFISKKHFKGRLEMTLVVKSSRRSEAAYCPHEKKYITFDHTISLREGIKVYEDPEKPEPTQKPLINSRIKNPIVEEKSLLITTSNEPPNWSSGATTATTGAPDTDESDEADIDTNEYNHSCDELKPLPVESPTIGRAGDYEVKDRELVSFMENQPVESSIINAYATILCGLYPNAQISYLPCTAFTFSSTNNTWSIAKDIDSLINNLIENASPLLTTVATIVRIEEHWMLFIANSETGHIGIADTLGGYFDSELLNEGVSIFVEIIDSIFGEREKDWESNYLPEIVQQSQSYSCGEAALYFLEKLYLHSSISCEDPSEYENYKKIIVEKILLTTDEGQIILQGKNDYTEYLEN